MTYVKINSEKKIVKIISFRKITYKNRNTYTVCEESLKCILKKSHWNINQLCLKYYI